MAIVAETVSAGVCWTAASTPEFPSAVAYFADVDAPFTCRCTGALRSGRRAPGVCRTRRGPRPMITSGQRAVTADAAGPPCSLQAHDAIVRWRRRVRGSGSTVGVRRMCRATSPESMKLGCRRVRDTSGNISTGKFPVNYVVHREPTVNSAGIAIRVVVMCGYHRNLVRSRVGMRVPPSGLVLSHAQDSGYIAPRARVAKGTSCLQ
jgi:hypothetical protein